MLRYNGNELDDKLLFNKILIQNPVIDTIITSIVLDYVGNEDIIIENEIYSVNNLIN